MLSFQRVIERLNCCGMKRSNKDKEDEEDKEEDKEEEEEPRAWLPTTISDLHTTTSTSPRYKPTEEESVAAEEEEEEEEEEDTTTLTEEEEKEFTNGGCGVYSDCPKDAVEFEVKDGYTLIGDSAFYNCESLKTVKLPESIKTINEDAFYNCSSLQKIDLPLSLTTLGDSAFQNCSSLQKIDLPLSLTTLGKYTFSGCSSLKEINGPPSLMMQFENCDAVYRSYPAASPPDKVSSAVYEGDRKDGEKQEMVLTVEPKNCYAMVSFNNAASGKDAEELAHFLTKNGRPTFCTRIYCPENIGSWREITKLGAAECKYYIPLLTNGWQKSGECQFETQMVVNRLVDKEVKVLPVFFDDFDVQYDKESGHYYKLIWKELQSVWRNSDDWKQKILKLVPKA